jgi:D-lactate dehydrogenase (cytochrome)
MDKPVGGPGNSLKADPVTIASVIDRLKERYGNRVQTAQAIRENHSHGEGYQGAGLPDAVLVARNSEEIAIVLQTCLESRVPVIPFGAGSSLEGQVQATYGGISLDLSEMKEILSISAEDLDCRVQAGVTREQLNQYVRDKGLFFPIDPGAHATLGGMAATRASGTNAVRYGTMRDAVLGLTVVTPEGRIIRTGGRARKSSAGYDLTRLYVGSEGTLGVITEIQLRLHGIPESIAAAVCQFPDLGSTVNAVIATMQMGIPLARIELLDALQMKASIAYSGLEGFEEKPTLFMEFHGTVAGVKEQIAQLRELADMFGGGAFQWAHQPEDRTRLWKARHAAYYAGMALAPGKQSFATDACVPISRLAECIIESREEADASGLVCPITGHVGDGNFHALVLFDPENSEERAKAETLVHSISRRAIRMGGTCSGEHGIGLHKLGLLHEEFGEAVGVMQKIKRALDPQNIMNPGKTVPLD